MVINKNTILYFSGTGNTYDISSKVAKDCNMDLINCASLINESEIEIMCDVLGITFPVYYGGMPKIVNRTIDKLQKTKDTYIFSVATYGGIPADPLKLVDIKLRGKNLKLSNGFLINMPGNYLPSNGARSEKVQRKNFEKADKKVEKMKSIINEKKVEKYERSPFIIDRPFYIFAEKRVDTLAEDDRKFYVDKKCSNCGLCAKVCPVNNISIVDGNIKWLGKCEQCMACIQYCPKEAIQVGHKTINRKRYTNPNVDYLKKLLGIKSS